MGRKPSRWTNLPKGMRARPRGNLIHYYFDTGKKPRKEIPLGSDYIQAVKKWTELTAEQPPAGSAVMFSTVKDAYWRDVLRKIIGLDCFFVPQNGRSRAAFSLWGFFRRGILRNIFDPMKKARHPMQSGGPKGWRYTPETTHGR